MCRLRLKRQDGRAVAQKCEGEWPVSIPLGLVAPPTARGGILCMHAPSSSGAGQQNYRLEGPYKTPKNTVAIIYVRLLLMLVL